jgi:hypothetical protein
MTRRRPAEDEGVAEPAAKGFLRLWLAAKLLPIAVRLATWAAWLLAVLAYAGFVAWMVRRLAKRGVLDEATPGGPPIPVSARDDGILAWVRGDETFDLKRTSLDGET